MEIKTKIIATVGPSTLDFENFSGIIDEGVNIIRFNSAYGDEKQYDKFVEYLSKKGKNVKILFDIRTVETLEHFSFKNRKPDMIALSFTESGEQLKKMKEIMPESKTIAKIETKKGVENFDDILDECWGVMVARGDLGKTKSIERVPCLQKMLTRKTLEKKKFLIIATEMLLSMVDKKEPTRAEASDVANAVFENACAVMLSEETAVGNHPVECVRYMKSLIWHAENCEHV